MVHLASSFSSETAKNHHKLLKTLDQFAHVPIPDQTWWALSIPLINSSPSSLLSPKIFRNHYKLQKNLDRFTSVSSSSQPLLIPYRIYQSQAEIGNGWLGIETCANRFEVFCNLWWFLAVSEEKEETRWITD